MKDREHYQSRPLREYPEVQSARGFYGRSRSRSASIVRGNTQQHVLDEMAYLQDRLAKLVQSQRDNTGPRERRQDRYDRTRR